MKTKFLRLVNNERMNVRIASRKGDYRNCTGGAVDICPSQSMDVAFCGTYAYDKCTVQDLAACQDGAHDRCTIDREACYGPGEVDIY